MQRFRRLPIRSLAFYKPQSSEVQTNETQAFVSRLCLLFAFGIHFAQGNGRLQLHFMDVGQGDGAILIHRFAETVLFDNGDRNYQT
jgi:hypothetical protein